MRDDWLDLPQTRQLLANLHARLRDCERRALSVSTWDEVLALKSEYATLHGIIKLIDRNGKYKEDNDA